MDPDEALRRIRELVRPGAERDDPDGSELSELVAGLDEWLSKGGFLPAPWQAGRLLVPAPAYLDDDEDDESGDDTWDELRPPADYEQVTGEPYVKLHGPGEDGTYVLARGMMWKQGIYADEAAARYAGENLTTEQIEDLWLRVAPEPITVEHMRADHA